MGNRRLSGPTGYKRRFAVAMLPILSIRQTVDSEDFEEAFRLVRDNANRVLSQILKEHTTEDMEILNISAIDGCEIRQLAPDGSVARLQRRSNMAVPAELGEWKAIRSRDALRIANVLREVDVDGVHEDLISMLVEEEPNAPYIYPS